ncbi:MAG: hypothetical protein JW751_19045 [Polyangiaceae bacterium]|nr:hypothetical protein [Polyangiaceae bacterium]
MVVDTTNAPPLEEVGDFGVYFRDSVVGCVEVKSRLTRKEFRSVLRQMARTKKVGPGIGTNNAIFAYETGLSGQQLLDAVENTVEFFDNRIYLTVVLGKFVITMSDFDAKGPRPHSRLTAFRPVRGLDLTLFQLVEEFMEIGSETPFKSLRAEIREYFEPVASRDFTCPEERPGPGAQTNLVQRSGVARALAPGTRRSPLASGFPCGYASPLVLWLSGYPVRNSTSADIARYLAPQFEGGAEEPRRRGRSRRPQPEGPHPRRTDQ